MVKKKTTAGKTNRKKPVNRISTTNPIGLMTSLRRQLAEERVAEIEYGLKELIQGLILGFIIGFIIAMQLV